jgi:hypothetical protein
MVSNPEEEALAALKAHQEEAGMQFEDPDAPVTPFGKQDPESLWP